jgi:hypothetical protein
MGPRLILDKSAIQMLSAKLIPELSLWFDFVTVPTLFREIIGNLKKEPSQKKGKRLPLDMLREIAGKLAQQGAAVPASFKQLALQNLIGNEVQMNGFTVPLDSSAINVHGSQGMLSVDSTMMQALLARWARGEYTPDDELVAKAWRENVEQLNMSAAAALWKSFVKSEIGDANSIEDIVAKVDSVMADPDHKGQLRLAAVLIALLRSSERYLEHYTVPLTMYPGATMPQIAPYSASVLRLYLTFMAALSLGLIKRDANSPADLQYLFYTPFAAGFASNDNLHRTLYPAATGPAIFVPAQELRKDLERRLAWRDSMSFEQWADHRREYGMYPMEFAGSIISKVWVANMRPRPPVAPEPPDGELTPEIKKMIERVRAMEAESKVSKLPEDAAWPLGQKPEDVEPL